MSPTHVQNKTSQQTSMTSFSLSLILKKQTKNKLHKHRLTSLYVNFWKDFTEIIIHWKVMGDPYIC